jgi:hypothetical protein
MNLINQKITISSARVVVALAELGEPMMLVATARVEVRADTLGPPGVGWAGVSGEVSGAKSTRCREPRQERR